jgi:hypothetical protein
MANISARFIGVGTALFFVVLIGISAFVWWRQESAWQDQVIHEHIATLHEIFVRIDTDCKIISFEHQKNYIDFLTVVKFVGSEVGSMNLAHPEKWQGPYLNDNPTFQEKYYQIVRTHKGYYIVPGEGVELSNGKVIGKDIIFNEDADIQAMMQEEHALKSKQGYNLAALLPLHQVTLSPTVEAVVQQDVAI